MSPQCQQMVADVGNGIGASLRGVDCLASDMTQAAFGRLFGSGGALMPALTIILTLYVAFFAFALITGRTRIGIRALTPRIVTLGMVLTLATSWLAYQTLVWNVATGAPDQIAGILTGTKGSATQVFGDKIDIVFSAIQEASGQGQQQQAAGAQPKEISTFSPEGMMWMGATMLLLGTVGVLVTARIALAVLMAVGPVFVVLALFPATRGLFAGWLRGWVMMAIAPLFAVVGGTMILELAIPVINAMIAVPGKVDPRAAMAFFLVGAVHISLMFMVLKVSATMVGNWSVFGLAGSGGREPADNAPAPNAHTAPAPIEIVASQGQGQVFSAPRRIAISPAVAGMAANDAGPTAGGSSHSRETRIVAADGAASGSLSSAPSRARGIGSRFRAAPVRSSEKFK